MPINYTYYALDHTVRTKVSGCLQVESVCHYLNSLVDDPGIPNGFLEIVDFDDVSEFGFEHSNIRQILAAYKRMKSLTHCIGTVFIASNPVAYGLCRVQMGFYDSDDIMSVIRSHDLTEETIREIRTKHPLPQSK